MCGTVTGLAAEKPEPEVLANAFPHFRDAADIVISWFSCRICSSISHVNMFNGCTAGKMGVQAVFSASLPA